MNFGAYFGAVGLVDSISSLGMGVAYAITGLLMDADDDKGILDAPESLTNAVAKSIEKIAGTEDQKIEGAMNMLMGLTTFPWGIEKFAYKEGINALLSLSQTVEGLVQVINDSK